MEEDKMLKEMMDYFESATNEEVLKEIRENNEYN